MHERYGLGQTKGTVAEEGVGKIIGPYASMRLFHVFRWLSYIL